MSLPDPPRVPLADAAGFRLHVEDMSDFERQALLQCLMNEWTGVKAELRRLQKIGDRLKSRMNAIRSVCNGTTIRGGTRDGFVRYNVSTLFRRKTLPLHEREAVGWALMDQHGRTARDFWFCFKGGSKTVRRLKETKRLTFQWHRRTTIRTRDLATVFILLREEQKRASFLHVQARFPGRDKKQRVQTSRIEHFYVVRSLDGSTEVPKVITAWKGG